MSHHYEPKKLILIYLDQTADKNIVLKALSNRIKKELHQIHLNALETDKLIQSPQVPYTILISDRTLFDGVVLLKHFEPRINEEVHVSNLTERLLLQTGAVSVTAAATEPTSA